MTSITNSFRSLFDEPERADQGYRNQEQQEFDPLVPGDAELFL
jgi:hypothetical protein